MGNKKLYEIFVRHEGYVSDKWSLYFDVYEREFSKLKAKDISLLEVGVQNGGSLEIWSKYLDIDKIVGVDINPKCSDIKYEEARIKILVADINKEETFISIKQEFNNGIDIIIDDGSHSSSDIIKTFQQYFPLLKDDGLFVVEDLHCSYWHEFGGGLYDPLSSMSFFKCLIDIINFEHWGVTNKKRVELLAEFEEMYKINFLDDVLSSIHSIRFYNSMCIIEKKACWKNNIGKRHIVGKKQNVCSLEKLGESVFVPSQDANSFSTLKKSLGYLYQKISDENDSLEKENKLLKEERKKMSDELLTIRKSFLGKLFFRN